MRCPRCLRMNPPEATLCACGSVLFEGGRVGSGEEWKIVTVLFADIVGYTRITENLGPDEVKAVLDRLFAACKDAIEIYRGRVEMIAGDEIVSFYGAPIPNERHSEAAIRAAVEIRASLAEIAGEGLASRGIPLEMRFGAAAGRVVFGRNVKGDYSLTGPAMVLGKRLETAARPGAILVNRTAMEAARNVFEFEPVTVPAKHGKTYEAFEVRAEKARDARAAAFSTPFVGRDRELARIEEHARAALAGEGLRLVSITGPEGIGRKRLLHEFLAHLTNQGKTIVRSASEDVTGGSPVALLWGVAESCRDNAPFFLFEDLLRSFHHSLALPAGGVTEAERLAEREKTIAVLFDELAGVAKRMPAIVVLEGLQWADEGSLEALRTIASAPRPGPPLLLVALAGDPVEFPLVSTALLEPLAGSEIALHLPLRPLSERAMREILASIPGFEDHSLAVRDLLRAAEGSPHFLQEMLQALVQDGQIVESEGRWRVAEGLRIQIPDSLATAILARLDRLPEPQKVFLRHAAIVGRRFRLQDVERILPETAGVEAGGWAGSLAALQRAGLVSSGDGEGADSEHAFTSELLHRVAYQSLLRRRRMDCHRILAGRLAEVAGARPGDARRLALLAHHQHEAELWEESIETLARAAQAALAVSDGRSAVRLLTRALATSRRLGRDLGREVPILERLVEAHLAQGENGEALQGVEMLLAPPYLEELEAEPRGRALALKGRVLRRERRLEEALAAVRAAAEELRGTGGDAEFRALLDLGWLEAKAEGGFPDRAGAALARARALGDGGAPGRQAELALVEGAIRTAAGDAPGALESLETAQRSYEAAGDRYGQALAHAALSDLWRERGDPPRSRRHLEESGRLLASVGLGTPSTPGGAQRFQSLFLDRSLGAGQALPHLSLAGFSIGPRDAPALGRDEIEREKSIAMARIALARGMLGLEEVNRCLERAWEDPAGAFDGAAGELGFLDAGAGVTLARAAGEEILRGATVELPEYRLERRPGRHPTFVPVTGRRIGEYEILAELGRGGMGVVYRARQEGLGRDVALKVLGGPGLGEMARARFEREARSASKLHHPGIVAIHAFHLGSDLCYYSMELVEGASLDREIRSGPMPPEKAARLVRQVAEATHYAHLNGVVHRDLKPANVLLRPDGSPSIADFGLARSLEESGLTASGDVLGTPSYMAPEQASGAAVGPAADVYSLGAVLYECLAGRAPFVGDSVAGILASVLREDPPPVRNLRPDVPAALATICAKAMRKEPGARYETAGALAEDLERYLSGEPIRARRVGPLERLYLWARRHRALAATASTAIATICGLLVFHFIESAREEARSEAGRETALVRGSLEERRRWVEADRLVQAAASRIEAGLAGRRMGRPEALADQAGEIRRLLEEAEGRYPDVPSALVVRARLGRLLGAEEEARRLLDRVLERDPSLEVARYERGLLFADEFARALERRVAQERERRLGVSANSTGAATDLLSDLRIRILGEGDPELDLLRRRAAEDLGRAGAAGLYPGRESCGRGLEAYHRGELDRAERELAEAVRLDPKLIEGWLALAEIAVLRRDPAGAVERLRQAVAVDAGWWRPHWELARALTERAGREEEHGKDPGERYAEAVAEADRAFELHPGVPFLSDDQVAEIWASRIATRYNLAAWRQRQGGDPLEPMEQAVEIARSFADRAPRDAWRQYRLGTALAGLAYVENVTGVPADETSARAVDAYRRALEIDPDLPEFHAGLGGALAEWADSRAAHGGESPAALLDEAILHLDRAIDGLPGETSYRLVRVLALSRLAEGGSEVTLLLERAERDLDFVAEREPDNQILHLRRGQIEQRRATLAAGRAESVLAHLRAARAAYDRAIEAGPGQPILYAWRSLASLELAEALQSSGAENEEIERALDEAVEDAARASSPGSASAESLRRLAAVECSRGGFLLQAGRREEGRAALLEALEHVQASLDLSPARVSRQVKIQILNGLAAGAAAVEERMGRLREAIAESDLILAEPPGEPAEEARGTALAANLRAQLALSASASGADVASLFEDAIRAFERAAELEPENPDHPGYLALLLSTGATSEKDPGRKEVWLRRAIAENVRAHELAPADLDRQVALAEARLAWAVFSASRGEPDHPVYEAALADYGSVLARRPGDPSLRRSRGGAVFQYAIALPGVGEDPRPALELALADFEAVLAAFPGDTVARRCRGVVLLRLGLARSSRGEDGRALLARALADLRAAVALEPGVPWLRFSLLGALVASGEWLDAASTAKCVGEIRPDLAPLAAEWEADLRAFPEEERALGHEPWAAPLLDGFRAGARLERRRALDLYRQGLALWEALPAFERDVALSNELAARLLRQAHYEMAAILAAASRGDDGTGPHPLAVTAPEREALVRESVEHLRQAHALRPIPAAALRVDAGLSFTAIAQDPEFRSFLDSLGESPR